MWKKTDGHADRGHGPGHGTPMRLDFQSSQQPKEHNDGQSGDDGGKPPPAEGIVNLSPLQDSLLGVGVCYAAKVNYAKGVRYRTTLRDG